MSIALDNCNSDLESFKVRYDDLTTLIEENLGEEALKEDFDLEALLEHLSVRDDFKEVLKKFIDENDSETNSSSESMDVDDSSPESSPDSSPESNQTSDGDSIVGNVQNGNNMICLFGGYDKKPINPKLHALNMRLAFDDFEFRGKFDYDVFDVKNMPTITQEMFKNREKPSEYSSVFPYTIARMIYKLRNIHTRYSINEERFNSSHTQRIMTYYDDPPLLSLVNYTDGQSIELLKNIKEILKNKVKDGHDSQSS
jgi:hypothetical protein